MQLKILLLILLLNCKSTEEYGFVTLKKEFE